MMENKKSKAALFLSLLYLLLVAASFIIMLTTRTDTVMSGIFLVLLTPPWPLALGTLQKILHTDSCLLAGLFLLSGGAVISYILYSIISFRAGRIKNDGST